MQENRYFWFDEEAVSDVAYRYFLEAFDLGGNRSAPSNVAEARLRGIS